MGNSKSRIKSGSRRKNCGKVGRGESRLSGDNNNSMDCDEECYDTELLLLKRTINRDPETFILNNLMMCVQFFGNYEEEIKHVKESLASSRETELNKLLPPYKHVLLPDLLQERIAKNVGFTSTRQTFRPTIEPLHPVRIYTVHDNIDIVEEDYSPHYSSVTDSINILLRPTEHQGYVQLQLLDEFRIFNKETKKTDEADMSSVAENDDEIYSDGDSVYGPRPRSNLSHYPIASRRPNQGTVGNSKYKQARSLPILNDEQIVSEIEMRSRCNEKAETDYDGSSCDEQRRRNKRNWLKDGRPMGDSRQYEKHMAHSKIQTSQDQTSSNSSGYRSDNCAMDSDSSCNPNTKHFQDSIYEDIDECWLANGHFPTRCFKKITYTPDGKLYDPRVDKGHLLNSKQRRIKVALRRQNYDLFFVSSTEFMRHFKSVFIHRLAAAFGFDQESVEDLRREGCMLYCDKVMVSSAFEHSRLEQYEIIPAIWLQWPKCAQEWLDRPRNTWPDYNDVDKINDFGCYVVPEGYVPKKGSCNSIEDLEWQLTFPTAERYLETCLTQAQAQVYLITLMLHKTFMRPIFDTMFGLTAAHIKHKLFWMIEQNDRPSNWPDSRMGECLLTFLESLYHNISQNEPMLRDYFIKSRNLFQRIPCEHLLHTQKQLKRITENPVMYVFHAMENIRYSDNFFPRLDFAVLLRILTVDTLSLVNPALAQCISKPISRMQQRTVTNNDKSDGIGFWNAVKSQPNKYSANVVTNRTLINPRKAADAIIEISTRCAQLEGPRLCTLLDFFIRHFIKIAERYNQYNATQQKAIYLDHADRLSILLFEHHGYKDDARAYRDKIKVLRQKTANSRTVGELSETAKRKAESAIFVAPLKERFVGEMESENYLKTNNMAQRERPNRSINHAQPTTKATIHESPYEEPAQPMVSKKMDNQTTLTNRRSSAQSQISDTSSDEPPRLVITLREPHESLESESTYI